MLWQRAASLDRKSPGVRGLAMRNGRPDLHALRTQTPLHDTADELCAVARDFRLALEDIHLGARATEAIVKQLSSDGRLSTYRVVYFAAHGVLSEGISGVAEQVLFSRRPRARRI